jgi:hypothetical protein
MVREFRTQRRFWEEQVFNCKVGSDLYPSKKDEKKYDPKRRYNPAIPRHDWEQDYVSGDNCDDGDMAFFNGLLCAAGDARGCSGVALAQDTNGRWWRSKGKINEQETAGHAGFSTEAGLGVLLYMVKTGDKDRFVPWLQYIAGLARGYGGPLPRYCPHSECVFKIIDCPLFITVASRFEETSTALSICDPLRFLHLPTPDQILKELENGLKELIAVAARFEALHVM